jgi:LytS/YehU family sensor histidine kinase
MKVENGLKESRITLLSKEKEIQQQQKQLLFLGLTGLALISIVVFRNILLKRRYEINKRKHAENELQLQKLEYETSKAELQKQATELEMQALRAQMNPHFIFNSLNSINRFILQNNKDQAAEYLTKFSKLVRMILQNSQASLITLESELGSLELYLDLEALRFDNHFTYKVKLSSDIETEMLKVPPLIIQPYVENAIWHGLMHKDEKGHLEVAINMAYNFLFIKITDDGIGRNQAAAHNSKYDTKHKSVGLKITAERITKVQGLTVNESPVTIKDLIYADGSAAGTEVIIKIPVVYD